MQIAKGAILRAPSCRYIKSATHLLPWINARSRVKFRQRNEHFPFDKTFKGNKSSKVLRVKNVAVKETIVMNL